MTWLNNPAIGTTHFVSPSKTSSIGSKTKARAFRSEKHSRFSTIGTHLNVPSYAEPKYVSPSKISCIGSMNKARAFKLEKHSRFSIVGTHMNVPSYAEAKYISPSKVSSIGLVNKARAFKLEKHSRFSIAGTHLNVKSQSVHGNDVGLSHQERTNAQDLPNRKVTTKLPGKLVGQEERFQGPNTHFVKHEGVDRLPSIKENLIKGPATMAKNDWLKNLWIVSGTSMEDREMRKCEAAMAPIFRVHGEVGYEQRGVSKICIADGPRFTYQKPTSASSTLGPYLGQSTISTMSDAKGTALMRIEKHSRFSTYGSHLYNSKSNKR